MIVKKSLEKNARTQFFYFLFFAIPARRRRRQVWGGDGVIILESLAGYRLACEAVVTCDARYTLIRCCT